MSKSTAPALQRLALVVLLVALAIGGFILGRMTAVVPPGESSADVGFARDMHVHHAQAVLMADIIRERSQDPELKMLALDIIMTQQHQMGQMRGWLDLWGYGPNSRDLPMAWMGHPTAGPMPGMATDEQLRELERAPIAEAEARFLRLMIHHHQAGVEMARAALERARSGVVLDLARSIAESQAAEIELLQAMLQSRGHPPESLPPALPDSPADGHAGHN